MVNFDKFDFSEKIGLEGVVNLDTIYSVFIFLGVKIYHRGVLFKNFQIGPCNHLLHFLLLTTGKICWFSTVSSAVPCVRPNPLIMQKTFDLRISFCRGKQIGETYSLIIKGLLSIKIAASA